jgi:aryl-alcohol dehydrogenase-like predicted oxidoreductase
VGDRRHQVVIATKFAMATGTTLQDQGGSRRYVRRAVEASLERLDTDYIDLYQMHAPDPATPIEETLEVLDDLVREGKVRYLGHSNFAGWQLADAEWTARTRGCTPFVTAQNHYSLLDLAFCWLLSQDEIVSVIAGATSPRQVADNARAARDWRLSDEEMNDVAGILKD